MNTILAILRGVTAGLTSSGVGFALAALHDHRPVVAVVSGAIAAAAAIHCCVLTLVVRDWSADPPDSVQVGCRGCR